jgi:hypothetical protein
MLLIKILVSVKKKQLYAIVRDVLKMKLLIFVELLYSIQFLFREKEIAFLEYLE